MNILYYNLNNVFNFNSGKMIRWMGKFKKNKYNISVTYP